MNSDTRNLYLRTQNKHWCSSFSHPIFDDFQSLSAIFMLLLLKKIIKNNKKLGGNAEKTFSTCVQHEIFCFRYPIIQY